jgi:predicted nucleic acid-binding protein
VNAYADTGFLVSLYLEEMTSPAADAAFAKVTGALPLTALGMLELRNAFNLAIVRGRITEPERDRLWRKFEDQCEAGVFEDADVGAESLHQRARELSDRYTPAHATRSLDLLHVAAALELGAREFLTFDERQSRVAKAEGLLVRP